MPVPAELAERLKEAGLPADLEGLLEVATARMTRRHGLSLRFEAGVADPWSLEAVRYWWTTTIGGMKAGTSSTERLRVGKTPAEVLGEVLLADGFRKESPR